VGNDEGLPCQWTGFSCYRATVLLLLLLPLRFPLRLPLRLSIANCSCCGTSKELQFLQFVLSMAPHVLCRFWDGELAEALVGPSPSTVPVSKISNPQDADVVAEEAASPIPPSSPCTTATVDDGERPLTPTGELSAQDTPSLRSSCATTLALHSRGEVGIRIPS